MAICTGAYVLAAAGLLDQRPATTHWREAERLQRLFTSVRVDPDVLFVDDGDVLTSAGVAAGVDLVAHRAGFGTGASLRQHLHSAIGVSPLAYRRAFGIPACPEAV
nr:DJ-1/PfpI family protein [Kitasatospora sp. GP82]